MEANGETQIGEAKFIERDDISTLEIDHEIGRMIVKLRIVLPTVIHPVTKETGVPKAKVVEILSVDVPSLYAENGDTSLQVTPAMKAFICEKIPKSKVPYKVAPSIEEALAVGFEPYDDGIPFYAEKHPSPDDMQVVDEGGTCSPFGY